MLDLKTEEESHESERTTEINTEVENIKSEKSVNSNFVGRGYLRTNAQDIGISRMYILTNG